MVHIYKIYPNGFAANSYVLTADGKNAVVIDPAQPRVAAELDRLHLVPRFVLLTHCHFDHVGGVPELVRQGARVLSSRQERELIGTPADLFEYFHEKRPSYTVDETLEDGEEREFCGVPVRALLTPGHTEGSMCFLSEDTLFSGDTLFCGSVGRTDFPTGNARDLQRSLKRLSELPGDFVLRPGHDEDGSLKEEQRSNPWLRDL